VEHWEELRGSFCYCQKDNIIVVIIPIEKRLGPAPMRRASTGRVGEYGSKPYPELLGGGINHVLREYKPLTKPPDSATMPPSLLRRLVHGSWVKNRLGSILRQ